MTKQTGCRSALQTLTSQSKSTIFCYGWLWKDLSNMWTYAHWACTRPPTRFPTRFMDYNHVAGMRWSWSVIYMLFWLMYICLSVCTKYTFFLHQEQNQVLLRTSLNNKISYTATILIMAENINRVKRSVLSSVENCQNFRMFIAFSNSFAMNSLWIHFHHSVNSYNKTKFSY